MINKLRKLRSILTKIIWPKSAYWVATKSMTPLSNKFGFDRGTPIDRYWIESFLSLHHNKIHGRVLEIVDDTYTRKFGVRVTKSDVLDLDGKNKRANIIGNLKHIPAIKSQTYDCIILTHVLGMNDDYDAVISECHRILKVGGHLILTVACFSSLHTGDIKEQPYWRFTPAGANYAVKKHFKKVQVKSYGNVLSGQCFWVGMAQEELTKAELEYNDPNYPCIVGVVCHK